MTCHLVCIAKDEDPYIAEWVRYHRKLGFDKVHVYQNKWRWNAPEPDVDLVCWPGNGAQVAAYNNFLSRHYGQDGWAAFLDVDEFLVTPGFADVHGWLAGFEGRRAVAVNWMLFGSRCSDPVAGGVLRRFVHRSSGFDRHVKTLVNLSLDSGPFGGPHNLKSAARHDVAVSPDGAFVHGPWNYAPPRAGCFVGHFYCKTWPEYVKRRSVPAGDGVYRPPTRDEFSAHDFNEVEDTSLRDFLYERVNTSQDESGNLASG